MMSATDPDIQFLGPLSSLTSGQQDMYAWCFWLCVSLGSAICPHDRSLPVNDKPIFYAGLSFEFSLGITNTLRSLKDSWELQHRGTQLPSAVVQQSGSRVLFQAVDRRGVGHFQQLK